MSGETQRNESGWTTDTLKSYIEQRFADQDKAVQAALLAAKEAVLKAEAANEKQFEAANNVKSTFSGDLSRKLDRTEYESNHKALEDKIAALTDRMNLGDGANQGSTLTVGKIYAAIASVGVILGILVLLANGIF